MLFAMPVCAVHAQEVERTRAGVEAAERWLVLADAGQGEASWTQAAAAFRGAVTQGQWSAALKQARTPLGALTSRKLANARSTRTLPGAPDGDYVVIQYDAVYANRAGVTETLVATREADGAWKVVTYLIQ